jgi:hypothetical protein
MLPAMQDKLGAQQDLEMAWPLLSPQQTCENDKSRSVNRT